MKKFLKTDWHGYINVGESWRFYVEFNEKEKKYAVRADSITLKLFDTEQAAQEYLDKLVEEINNETD